MQGSGSKSNDPTTWPAWPRAGSRSSDLTRRNLFGSACRPCRLAVPSRGPQRLNAGSAVRGSPYAAVDVFTVGPYARKSWILSRYAFGDGYRVGIIAGSPDSYDPRFGWPQEEVFWSSFATWPATCTRSSGFYSRESVSKLGQPNPSARCSWPASGRHTDVKLRQPFNTTSVPSHIAAASMVSVEICLDDEPGL